MPSLGDSSGFFTWAKYRRWPYFAMLLGGIGLVVGALFFGILGFAIGTAGGALLGFIFGGIMGRNRAMFPIEVHKYATYASGGIEPIGKFPGRVITQTFTGADSAFLQRRIVEYLEGSTLKQLPNFNLSMWDRQGDKKILRVLQVDNNTFLPITQDKGVIIAHEVPVYLKNERGEIVKFKLAEDGKSFVKDAQGNYIPDANGAAVVVGTTRQEIFDANVMYDSEQGIVQIPKGLAAKTDNERLQYTQGYRIAIEFNKALGWFSKYGTVLVGIVSIAAIVMIVMFAFIKFSDANHEYVSSMKESLTEASQNNLKVAELNAQISAQLLKAGFNYSASFGNLRPSPTPPPVQGSGNLNLPFIGG